MVIQCVCFIGKLNQPLCYRQYDSQNNELPLQMSVYGSLDFIDAIMSQNEAQSASQQPQVMSADPYLGYLGPALGASSLMGLAAWNGIHQQRLSTSNEENEGQQFELPIHIKSCSISPISLPNDLSMYGYVTSTNLKIIAVLEESSTYSDPDLRSFFRCLHRLYADAISNPFFIDRIKTPKFLEALDQIVIANSKILSGQSAS